MCVALREGDREGQVGVVDAVSVALNISKVKTHFCKAHSRAQSQNTTFLRYAGNTLFVKACNINKIRP